MTEKSAVTLQIFGDLVS